MQLLAVSAKDAAKLTSLSYWSLLRMAKRGDIRVCRAGRKILFPMEEIKRWLEGKKV